LLEQAKPASLKILTSTSVSVSLQYNFKSDSDIFLNGRLEFIEKFVIDEINIKAKKII